MNTNMKTFSLFLSVTISLFSIEASVLPQNNRNMDSFAEYVTIVPPLENIPIIFSATTGILKSYRFHCSYPVENAFFELAHEKRWTPSQIQNKLDKLNKIQHKQEINELKIIKDFRREHGQGNATIGQCLSSYLYISSEGELNKAINDYLDPFFLYAKTVSLSPTTILIKTFIDNGVAFILTMNNNTYFCLGYMENMKEFHLLVANLKEVVPYRYSVIQERLERMKQRKEAKKEIEEIEQIIRTKGANFSYQDYVFKLKTSKDKPYIQTIEWQPSSEQTMTVIYPPRCNKQALQEYLE